jgi:hypothetical protein
MHRLFTITLPLLVATPLFVGLFLSGCSTPNDGPEGDDPDGLQNERSADEIEGGRDKFKSASKQEFEDFRVIWELYRKRDPRWPTERDRFKRRSDGAATLLSATFLKYYMEINAQRSARAAELVAVKSEIVSIGRPCAPYLIEFMVLDRMKREDGKYFVPDDITRRDCQEMLWRMGSESVPDLLAVFERDDVGVKGRRLAAKTLGATKDRRALAPLIKLLKGDPSWQVRADTASGLGLLGDSRAIPALNNSIVNDKDEAVRKRAAKARQQITAGGTSR